MSAAALDLERWPQVEALLDATLDLPPEEQQALLDAACAGEPQLRARVEALLAADRESRDFLTHPGEDAAALLADDAAEASLVGEHLDAYRLVREIASGGMGVVYEAVHTRLVRPVAIKLLPPELAADPVAKERLVREARAAAALDDPHICGVHDLGESGGRLYMVMPLCEGETLKDVLRRGPLPVAEARAIAVQVAQALVHAHSAGIIHRDLKPANVMLDAQGTVKVLDFGIAKVRGDPSLTRAGSSPGTPAYMSPEQVRGEPLDARTDVWGLGVLLYELLAGCRAFGADDDRVLLQAILDREPAPLEQLRPEVGPGLAGIVTRAMAKDRERRYADAASMLADLETGRARRQPRRLRRPAAAAVVGAVAALGVAAAWWAISQSAPVSVSRAAATPSPPTVAVLPFVNRTGRAELDGYGGAMARVVMDSLSTSRHLQVVSEQRAAELGGTGDAELARRAVADGIDVVLTGEILPSGQRLRVGARLVDVGEGRLLKAVQRDVAAPEALVVSADDVARAAREGLGVPPGEQIGGLAADFLARNPEAYGDYARGLSAFLRYDYPEAEPRFLAALEKAPDFTMARYRLALLQYVTSRTDEALANIGRAVAEAGGLPDREARYVRAAEALFARRTDEAIAAYRALSNDYPYETEVRLLLAQALMSRSRAEEALVVLAELRRLEPHNALSMTMAADANVALRRFHAALDDLRQALALEPDDVYARHLRASVYQSMGELDMAAAELSKLLRQQPGYHAGRLASAEVDLLRGREREAEQRLLAIASSVEVPARHRITAGLDLAWLYRARGRFRAAERVLDSLRGEVDAEKVRAPTVLAVRGLARMERGDLSGAARLLDDAVTRSAGDRRRHRCALVARGLLELRRQALPAVQTTALQIRAAHPAAGGADRSDEKAAAYLLGLRSLAAGQPDRALDELSRAVDLPGEECHVYREALARADLAAGRLPESLAAARQAAEERDPGAPRFDLELDRERARLAVSQAVAALGREAEAAAGAREFLERWSAADPGSADVALARRLARGRAEAASAGDG